MWCIFNICRFDRTSNGFICIVVVLVAFDLVVNSIFTGISTLWNIFVIYPSGHWIWKGSVFSSCLQQILRFSCICCYWFNSRSRFDFSDYWNQTANRCLFLTVITDNFIVDIIVFCVLASRNICTPFFLRIQAVIDLSIYSFTAINQFLFFVIEVKFYCLWLFNIIWFVISFDNCDRRTKVDFILIVVVSGFNPEFDLILTRIFFFDISGIIYHFAFIFKVEFTAVDFTTGNELMIFTIINCL